MRCVGPTDLDVLHGVLVPAVGTDRLDLVSNAGHVERIVRGWRRVDQLAEARETTHRHKSRAPHMYENEDGMVVIRGRLTPEAGTVLRWPNGPSCVHCGKMSTSRLLGS